MGSRSWRTSAPAPATCRPRCVGTSRRSCTSPAPAASAWATRTGTRGLWEGEALRGLFGVPGDDVRIVVLSGCDPLGIIQPLSEVVDYTVAASTALGGESAAAFADAFYTALAMGRTVLAAFELGLSRLELAGNPGAAAPVRRIRRGVNLDATLMRRPDAGVEREGRRWARRRAWAPARRS